MVTMKPGERDKAGLGATAVRRHHIVPGVVL